MKIGDRVKSMTSGKEGIIQSIGTEYAWVRMECASVPDAAYSEYQIHRSKLTLLSNPKKLRKFDTATVLWSSKNEMAFAFKIEVVAQGKNETKESLEFRAKRDFCVLQHRIRNVLVNLKHEDESLSLLNPDHYLKNLTLKPEKNRYVLDGLLNGVRRAVAVVLLEIRTWFKTMEEFNYFADGDKSLPIGKTSKKKNWRQQNLHETWKRDTNWEPNITVLPPSQSYFKRKPLMTVCEDDLASSK